MAKETFENAKFKLGQIMLTRGVSELIKTNLDFDDFVWKSLKRHSEGDWGNLSAEDKQANDEALIENDRIFSAYGYAYKKIWIITEWDRSVTTILFPSEY